MHDPFGPLMAANPPAIIHWTRGQAQAKMSIQARRLLGESGPDALIAIERVWSAIDATDRPAVARALRSVRPGVEPVVMVVRLAGEGGQAGPAIRIVFEAIGPKVDDGASAWDVYLLLQPQPLEAEATPTPVATHSSLVCYDGLTGQPNRLRFRDQVELAMRRAARERALLAVLSIEATVQRPVAAPQIAGFEARVLRALSVRIGRSLRAEDLAALSESPAGRPAEQDGLGIRFAVLLSRINEPQDAVRIAARILDTVGKPLELDGQLFQPSLSTGIALYPWDDPQADGLIRRADSALERALVAGAGSARFFSKPMNALSDDRLALEESLRSAVQREEFVLHFQPRVDGHTGRIVSHEALIRWQRPEQGLMAPGGFIDAAEQSRLIIPIGAWVLQQACEQARRWQDGGLPAVPMAVNVSAVQFREPDFVAGVARALERSGLAAENLEIEITESVVMNDAADGIRTMRALKALGVRIAIDDFGTGFSSLAYLKDFPIDALRLDRSFVHEITRDNRFASMTCAIIDLGTRLGLVVAAKGVETEDQRRFLLEHGCREMQGFLFARPMEASALADRQREQSGHLSGPSEPVSLRISGPTTVQ